DLACPPWRDDPAKLITIIAQRLRGEREDPETRFARVRTFGEETLARARVALADRPDDLARFEEVVATALRAGPLTEEHNYWIDRGRRRTRDGSRSPWASASFARG